MELFCAHCTKKIVDGGTIHEGRPYHDDCLRTAYKSEYDKSVADLEKMCPGLDAGQVESIIQAENPKLIEDLRGPWTVLYTNDIGEFETDSYGTKDGMLRGLEEWATDILNGLSEPWDIDRILFRGKLRYTDMDIEDKLRVELTL